MLVQVHFLDVFFFLTKESLKHFSFQYIFP